MSEPEGTALSVGQVLDKYADYVHSLDDLCQVLREKYGNEMKCRPGCTDCCQKELTVFPVEAASIRRAFESLSGARKQHVKSHLEGRLQSEETGPCPLLMKGLCVLYPARPLLCRTEGFLLASKSPDTGEWTISACLQNFGGMDPEKEVPAGDLINLESLNHSLAVLNHAYLLASGWTGPERVRLSEVLTTPVV